MSLVQCSGTSIKRRGWHLQIVIAFKASKIIKNKPFYFTFLTVSVKYLVAF